MIYGSLCLRCVFVWVVVENVKKKQSKGKWRKKAGKDEEKQFFYHFFNALCLYVAWCFFPLFEEVFKGKF